MADIKKYLADKGENKFGWIFLFAFIIVMIGVDIIRWDTQFFFKNNYHAYLIGFITWLVYSVRNQIIVDNKLFCKYSLIAIALVALVLVKMLITSFSVTALFAISFPLIYLTVLRLLIFIFFPDYPISNNILIISYTKTGTYWKGKEEGIVPSKWDKRLSIWLDIVTYIVMFMILFSAIL